jgi:hypothetical protein
LAEVRKLAQKEFTKIRRDRAYRSGINTLRKLASCDMHLTLPGARASEFFDERWFETTSMLATEVLGATGGKTRRESAARVLKKLAKDIGMRSGSSGSKALAPIVAAAGPENWSREDKRLTRELLRAKDGKREAHYARLLARHDKLLFSLKKACRRAD